MDFPQGYSSSAHINVYTDRQTYRRLNVISGLLGLMGVLLGWAWKSFAPLLAVIDGGMRRFVLFFLATVVGILVYRTLHGLLRAGRLYLLSGMPPFFRRTRGFFCVGSEAFLRRWQYLAVTLLPNVILGAALIVACCFIPDEWFWAVYGSVILNFAGPVGDYYTIGQVLRMPRSVLVRVSGVSLFAYTEE